MTPAVLFELKRLLLIEDEDQINSEALCNLGGSLEPTAEGMTKTLTCLQRWVLTVIGPRDEKSWILRHEPGEGGHHRSSLCFACPTFSTYGTCSHCYVGYRLTGHLNEDEPLKRQDPKRKTKKKTALLTPRRDAAGLPSKERKAQATQRATTISPDLRKLLNIHNMQQYAALFCRYELTEEELKNWSLAALMELLGSPAASTRRFLEAVRGYDSTVAEVPAQS